METAELNERAMAFWRDKDEVRQYLPDYIFFNLEADT